MRILMCNKYFRKQGASTKYFFGLSDTFEAMGHSVIHFSMHDDRNVKSPYAPYFVNNLDFNERVSRWRYLAEGLHAVYSLESRSKVERLIKDTRPDVVMLFNVYHHLSPSILDVFKRYSLPTVLLLEDYFLICPSYRLYANGRVCECCKGGRFYNAVRQRCFRGSRLRSASVAMVAYIHKFMRIYERNITAYIAPSEFMRSKHIQFGLNAEGITVIPHALPLDRIEPCYGGDDYIVYIGILEQWKGVSTLLRSMKQLEGVRLIVLGDGRQRAELQRLASEWELTNVEFAGYVIDQAFKEIVRGARFVVVPSEWYEVFGTVTWEAFAYGKPVIGSRIGAIPELVQAGLTGYLFETGNSDELADKIQFLFARPELCQSLGRSARRLVESKLSMDENYRATISLFEELIESSSCNASWG